VQVVNERGDAEGDQEYDHGHRKAGAKRHQEHLVSQVLPAEHDAGNPAEGEADADHMLDQLKVNNEGIDHVAGRFSVVALEFKATVETGCEQAAGDSHAEKKDSRVDTVASEKTCLCIDLLHTDSEKE